MLQRSSQKCARLWQDSKGCSARFCVAREPCGKPRCTLRRRAESSRRRELASERALRLAQKSRRRRTAASCETAPLLQTTPALQTHHSRKPRHSCETASHDTRMQRACRLAHNSPMQQGRNAFELRAFEAHHAAHQTQHLYRAIPSAIRATATSTVTAMPPAPRRSSPWRLVRRAALP